MRTQCFEIHLEGEVAVGTPGTVEGGRDTLDYMSGGLLLGAAAACYKQLGPWAWDVFHTGKVRFSDALPVNLDGPGVTSSVPRSGLIEGLDVSPLSLMGLPMPKCFAQPKEAAEGDALVNLIHRKRNADLNGAGDPYLTLTGERFRPKTHYRLKTAIDPRSGVSMARQLYGYHSLRPGQIYLATLEADDEVPEDVFRTLVRTLSGSLRLGRSRSAEYGRCRAYPIGTPQPQAGSGEHGVLHVLLLSHLVVEDDTGASVALPSSEQLGLPAAPLVAGQCFVRHQHHAIYNGTYRAYEADLFYLERGSVLSYEMDPAVIAELTQTPWRYAGLQRQRGYGRLWLQPPFLLGETPAFAAKPVIMPVASRAKPDHPLADWLERQAKSSSEQILVRELAEDWFRQLKSLYQSARIRAGVAGEVRVGPSPSQWGRVSEAARRQAVGLADYAGLRDVLFGKENGICKPGDPDWSLEVIDAVLEKRLIAMHGDRDQPENETDPEVIPTFRLWLRDKFDAPNLAAYDHPEKELTEQQVIHVLAHFARYASDRAKQDRQSARAKTKGEQEVSV